MRVQVDDDARQYLLRRHEFPGELLDAVGHVSFILYLARGNEINVGGFIANRERVSGNAAEYHHDG